ncbi:MarR family transcriptional regulator [Sphingomonas adhaesiva]|uniref:MarR family transcriptional regulator n=2 Tax=Sphingomonas adhaesiva TaxID=28212 RepID=A0A2A4I4N6_9SPHN|nr:MarR family transcriptional regulator [Sphingomonas adhaesiva]
MVVEKRVRQRLVDDFDMTLPRFDVLSALDRSPEGLTMGELSELLLVSNGNITQIVARLIDDGLVLRLADGPDRRVIRVRLTDRGRATFAAAAERHEGWIDHMMRDLVDDEIESLLASLDSVRASIERNRI